MAEHLTDRVGLKARKRLEIATIATELESLFLPLDMMADQIKESNSHFKQIEEEATLAIMWTEEFIKNHRKERKETEQKYGRVRLVDVSDVSAVLEQQNHTEESLTTGDTSIQKESIEITAEADDIIEDVSASICEDISVTKDQIDVHNSEMKQKSPVAVQISSELHRE